MDDAGFVIGSYALVIVGVGVYAWSMISSSRRTSRRVPDRDKPWL